jgi:putative hydrolase of the HAD superfamily
MVTRFGTMEGMTQQQTTTDRVATSRELDGVIFDLGGVMTEPLFRHRSDVPPEYLGLVAFFLTEFRDHYHLPTGAHDLHLLEIGKIGDDEFFERMSARYAEAGNEPVDPREAQKVIFGRGMVACAAMADAVRQIRDAGYKTAMLTNISREGESLFRELFPVDELFDVVVDSSKVGLRKPDPEIYRLTCDRLGIPPERCLFIDDLLCNVEAAGALGMQTILCLDPVEVADEVVQRLLGHAAAAEAEGGS